ncbi:MAG: ATP-binding cassette domain-containing protein, partial [Acidobacteriota bacterium]
MSATPRPLPGRHGMNTPTTTPAVEARDLRFAYPERVALDGVSFRVDPPRREPPDDDPGGGGAPGTLFGFLGPNGGGKTTLFRILATLLAPGAGAVRIFGHRLPDEAAAVRRRLGVVFQSPSLDLELTVRENLVHQGRLHGLTGTALVGAIADALGRLG